MTCVDKIVQDWGTFVHCDKKTQCKAQQWGRSLFNNIWKFVNSTCADGRCASWTVEHHVDHCVTSAQLKMIFEIAAFMGNENQKEHESEIISSLGEKKFEQWGVFKSFFVCFTTQKCAPASMWTAMPRSINTKPEKRKCFCFAKRMHGTAIQSNLKSGFNVQHWSHMHDQQICTCNTLICLHLAMHRVSSYGTHGVVTHSQKTRFSAYRTSCC